jgi:hypothetical protein
VPIPHAEAAHHRVLSAEHARDEARVLDVAARDSDVGECLRLAAVADDGGHRVAAVGGEPDEVPSAVSGRAEDDDLHERVSWVPGWGHTARQPGKGRIACVAISVLA